MNGRDRFSKIVSISFCVILLLSLAGFPEQEPFGFHLDSDGKRILLGESDVDPYQIQLSESDPVILCDPLDEGLCIGSFAALPGPSLPRYAMVDAGSLAPGGAVPGSPIVLRI